MVYLCLFVLFASLDDCDELEIVQLTALDRRLFPYLLNLQPTAQFCMTKQKKREAGHEGGVHGSGVYPN